MIERKLWGVSVALLVLLALLLAFASLPAARATSTTLLISEVQAGSAADANLEFVEVYNASTSAIDLNGHKLVYRSATGTSDVSLHTFGSGESIPAHGHLLLVHQGKDVGVTPDATFSASLGRTGGGLALRDGSNAIVDSLGWGSATNAFVETSPATAAPNDQSMERLPGGAAGNATDTDNNSADFHVLTTPKPQNTASPPTPDSAPRLDIAKSAPARVDVGQPFTYTLRVTNSISDTATPVVITDALPLSVTVAAISDGGAHLGGNVISWTVPSLAHQAQVTRTVVVTAPATAATLVNSDYCVWAGNWPTRTIGAPAQTSVVAPGACGSIYAIQYTTDPGSGTYPSPCVDEVVTVDGVVYATFSGKGFFIADEAGPWHGLYVYYPSGALPAIGDEVRVTGTVQEYYGVTELGHYASYTVLSSGNALYGPSVVTAAQIPYDTPATSEGYESVFVETHGITVTAGNDSHNIWTFTDASAGSAKADDWGYNAAPAVGDTLAILRGPLVYDFSEYKVMPRDAADVVETPPHGLVIAKTAPDNVSPGAAMTYVLTVQNYTGQTVHTVTVTDVAPAGVTFSHALDGGVESGGVVSWTAASLADQATLTVRFVVTATGSVGAIVRNQDYAAWAADWLTPTLGDPVVTVIGDYTPISAIQGDGFRSPLVGQTVKTRGVVAGFFQGNSTYVGDFNGFYIQDPLGDGDPDTSDGLFVKYATSLNPGVSVGDVVTVTGAVDEFSEYDGAACNGDGCQTQLFITSAGQIQKSGTSSLPAATTAEPPGDAEQGLAYWEALEGMRVTLPQTATVVAPTSYGTITVVSGTLGIDHVMRTGPYAGMPVGARFYNKYGSGADNLIVGSVVQNVDGPLAFTYGAYVVVTQSGDDWQTVYNKPAPVEPTTWPTPTVAEFTAGAFNTYNFPASSPSYAVKRAKVVSTIINMGAPYFLSLEEIDVAGVITDVLSDLSAAGYDYAYAYSHPDVGGHGVALLWRTDHVTDVTWATPCQACSVYGSSSSTYDPLWAYCRSLGEYPLFSRRPVIVTGTVTLDGEAVQVVAIANHFKAKSGGDPSDQRRLEQAQLVASAVDGLIANGSTHVIVMGDLNDFEDSDPLNALTASGNLVNTWYSLPAEARYSYIYGGKAQILDHILVSPALAHWLQAMSPLHYNADYPFNPYSSDDGVVWRTSDHEPVIATFAPQDYVLYLPLVMRESTP